jgi:N,N-dimethylformamidase
LFKILGYTQEISVAPGETLTCKISAEENQRYFARIVRLVNGDCNPEGPGFRVDPVPSDIEGWYEGSKQSTDAGSYMVVRGLSGIEEGAPLTFMAAIWPTYIKSPLRQVILALDGGGTPLRLLIEPGGRLVLEVGDSRVQLSTPLLDRHWYRVAVTVNVTEVTLGAEMLRDFPMRKVPEEAQATLAAEASFAGSDLYLAGAPSSTRVEDHFNGKIDRPTLLAASVPVELQQPYLDRPLPPGHGSAVIAAWDFSIGMEGTVATDIGPRRQHGELRELPARAMTGFNWTGQVHDWKQRPEEYGAIHFHQDDLYDANWTTSFTWKVPEDFRSGPYAVHVKAGENSEYATNEDFIPFYVRPPREKAKRKGRPKLAFLAPTNSYIAYANDSQVLMDRGAETGMNRLLNLQHADVYLHEHPELCASLYDKHADGSGVCYSSRLRPVLNMRPRYHSWLGSHGSALYQFNGDTHIFAWLEHLQVDYDIITDEDLHEDGFELLEGYQVVVTGTHPEYHSTAMWDAMKAFLGQGGRLIYMGGNGWYWRVAFHQSLPGVIEVRRAEDGTRTWEADPGEYYQSFNGEFGGLWRRVGRPPNLIAGIGFVAQGFDMSGYFRRQPGADSPRAGFIFQDVPDEIIGDFGLIGGGAAGIELDAMNHKLGTPHHALCLATSEGHTPLTIVTKEEVLVMPVAAGGDQHDKVRADMVFFETSSGGAVFSTGSIAWAGSLSWNGYDNNVARITGNVLRRFLEPAPFEAP